MATESWARSDAGRVRTHNDNAYFHSSRRGTFLVANGVGGGLKGQRASRILLEVAQQAADKFLEIRKSMQGSVDRASVIAFVNDVFQDASRAIFDQSCAAPELTGMATTAGLLFVMGRNAAIGHVGHNVAYHIRDGVVTALTARHTVAQGLMERGMLQPAQVETSPYRNVLTRMIGNLPTCEVDTIWLDLKPGDAILLASSGLADHVPPDDIASLLESAGPGGFVDGAIELANERGGKDNLTALLVRMPGGDADQDVLDSQARIVLLKKLSPFQHLSFQEVLRVLRVVYEVDAMPNEVIVMEGSSDDRLFVVAEGVVEVRKEGVTLTTLGEGRHFGDVSFVDGGERSASVVARTPVKLLAIRRSDFQRELLAVDPALCTKLLLGLSQNLAHRLRELSRDYVDVARGGQSEGGGA